MKELRRMAVSEDCMSPVSLSLFNSVDWIRYWDSVYIGFLILYSKVLFNARIAIGIAIGRVWRW